MNLSNLKSSQWLKNYALWINLAQWLGGILIVYILANLFWVWANYFTQPETLKPLNVKQQAVTKTDSNFDVSVITSRNIFGSVERKPVKTVEQPVDAPKTKLNLKLRGIYASDAVSKANAIIEDGRGQQAVYFIDEKLQVSGRVFLRQVFFDKVILETNGKNESLTLDKPELVMQVSKPEAPAERRSGDVRVTDKRKDQRISRQLNNYKSQFLENPASVSDVIRPSPYTVNGELQGFRISPGKDKRLFQDLGLRRGDIVTAINGVSLNNMQEAMTLMSEVQSLDELSVEIKRGEQQLSLLLNLNEKVGR